MDFWFFFILILTLVCGAMVVLAMELDPRKDQAWWRVTIRLLLGLWFIGLAALLAGEALPQGELVRQENTLFLHPGERKRTDFEVSAHQQVYFHSTNPFLVGDNHIRVSSSGSAMSFAQGGFIPVTGADADAAVQIWTYHIAQKRGRPVIILLAKLIWWGSVAAIIGLAAHFEGAVIFWLNVTHFGRAKEAIMDWHEEQEEARKEKEAQRTEQAAKEAYDQLDARRKSVRKEMETIRGSLPENVAPPIPASLMHYEGYLAEIQKRWKMAQMDRTGESIAKAMARYKELILEEANLNRAMIELAKTRWESKNLNETFSVMEARLKKEKVEADVDIAKAQRALDALQKSGGPEKRQSPDEKAEAHLREEEALRKSLTGRIRTRAQLEREVEQEYQKLLKEGWSEERAKEVVEQMRRDLWKALGG